MRISHLLLEEYQSYYSNYIKQAGDDELLEGLQLSYERTMSFFKSIPENKFEFAYDDGKWTIKELIQHLIDSERVFAYRALRFARADKTDLPGYDENLYTPSSLANRRTKDALLKEYANLRESTIDLFSSFNDDMMMKIGSANNGKMSVRAIGFVIIGHETHHCKVIKERYL